MDEKKWVAMAWVAGMRMVVAGWSDDADGGACEVSMAKYSRLIGIDLDYSGGSGMAVEGGDGWRGYLYCWRRVVRCATPWVAFMGITVTLEGTAAGLGSM